MFRIGQYATFCSHQLQETLSTKCFSPCPQVPYRGRLPQGPALATTAGQRYADFPLDLRSLRRNIERLQVTTPTCAAGSPQTHLEPGCSWVLSPANRMSRWCLEILLNYVYCHGLKLPSGKRLITFKNYIENHRFSWVNQLFRLGHAINSKRVHGIFMAHGNPASHLWRSLEEKRIKISCRSSFLQ